MGHFCCKFSFVVKGIEARYYTEELGLTNVTRSNQQ